MVGAGSEDLGHGSHQVGSGINPAGDRGDTSPQMSDGEGTVMHHVPPNMAEI